MSWRASVFAKHVDVREGFNQHFLIDYRTEQAEPVGVVVGIVPDHFWELFLEFLYITKMVCVIVL